MASPSQTLTAAPAIIKRIRQAKLFVFLRSHCPTLCADPFQQELLTLYKDQSQGQPPVPPAQLALAPLLQAYHQVSDDEVIAATTMDRHWQVVLDCLDCDTPPFRTGPLVALRHRLSARQLDRRLLERTVASAAASGAFGSRQLRAALDSSPLWGAGRDRAAAGAGAARGSRGGRGLPDGGATPQSGPGPGLGRCHDAPACTAADTRCPQYGGTLARCPARRGGDHLSRGGRLAVAQQGCAPDLTTTSEGTPTMRPGVAAERRISVEDAERHHGRQRRSLLVDGYKRHGLRDLESRLLVAVGVTPANTPEVRVTDAIETDGAAPQGTLRAWPIDRAYVARTLVQQRPATLAMCCQAWPGQHGPYVPTTAFTLDWPQPVLQCPGGVTVPFEPSGMVQFPAAPCAHGAVRPRCTPSASGRSVSLHPDAALLHELRERQQTPQGRAKLRERGAVDHARAHIGLWQGRRARYRGVRKHVFDLRRYPIMHNLPVLVSLTERKQQAA